MPRECIYLAELAQNHANKRKELSCKPYRMGYDPLVHQVFSKLRDGWTPEEIGGRLPHGFPADPRMRVSRETVYAWIYGQGRRDVHSDRIRWRVSIHDRPLDVESRTTFGHWALGIGHQTALLVRVTLVEYTPARSADPSFCVLRRFPRSPRRQPGGNSIECFPSCPPMRSPL